MKIKVSHLRSLIRECILTEEEMRNVTYLTQDNIVKLLKNYGVDKQVALEEDVKFYEMVKKIFEFINRTAKAYASTSRLMPEEDFIISTEEFFSRSIKNSRGEVPDFVKKLLRQKFHIKLLDASKITLMGRSGSASPDKVIVQNVLEKLAGLLAGSSDNKNLDKLANLFQVYGYKPGVKMSNELQGNITAFKDKIEKEIMSAKNPRIELDDVFVRSGQAGKEATSNLMKTKPGG